MANQLVVIIACIAQLAFSAIFLVTDGGVRTLAFAGEMLCFGTIVGATIGSCVRRRVNRRTDGEVS